MKSISKEIKKKIVYFLTYRLFAAFASLNMEAILNKMPYIYTLYSVCIYYIFVCTYITYHILIVETENAFYKLKKHLTVV